MTEETLTALAAAIDPPDPGRLFALWDFILDAVSIYSLDSLDDESLLLLGTAAASSGLPEKGLASLSSLFLKGRVAGIDAGEMIAITVRTLGSGGGIIGIDREIERRRPPR